MTSQERDKNFKPQVLEALKEKYGYAKSLKTYITIRTTLATQLSKAINSVNQVANSYKDGKRDYPEVTAALCYKKSLVDAKENLVCWLFLTIDFLSTYSGKDKQERIQEAANYFIDKYHDRLEAAFSNINGLLLNCKPDDNFPNLDGIEEDCILEQAIIHYTKVDLLSLNNSSDSEEDDQDNSAASLQSSQHQQAVDVDPAVAGPSGLQRIPAPPTTTRQPRDPLLSSASTDTPTRTDSTDTGRTDQSLNQHNNTNIMSAEEHATQARDAMKNAQTAAEQAEAAVQQAQNLIGQLNLQPQVAAEQPSPWPKFQMPDQAQAAADVSLKAVAPDAPAGGDDRIAGMFSRSLASTFNIHSIVPQKFDGKPDHFENFRLLWKRADAQMAALGLSYTDRFLELKKCLSGPALMYIDQLPFGADDSYQKALDTLNVCYSLQKAPLRVLIAEFLNLQKTAETHSSRQNFHARVVSYKNGLLSIGCTAADALLAFELSVLEQRMDEPFKNDWITFISKKRDTKKPLGYNITFDDFVNRTYEYINKQLRLSDSTNSQNAKNHKPKQIVAAVTPSDRRQFQRPPPPRNRVPVTRQQPQTPNRNRNNQMTNKTDKRIKVPCPFCPHGNQQLLHAYPRLCPLLDQNKVGRGRMISIVKTSKLCPNCFSPHHDTTQCRSTFACSTCGGKHHPQLHSTYAAGGGANSQSANQNRPSAAAATAAAKTETRRPTPFTAKQQ